MRFSESVNVLSLEAYQQSFHQRFDLARQLQGKLFFKVFPSCFREDTSEWLVNNHQFIASERKDLWEQVLSYLVSDATGQWYSETGINLAPHSLTATFKGFKTIERSVFHYQHLKKRLRPIASLSYEDDLLKKSASQILREVGLNGEFNQDFRQVQKQNMRPKEELFKNLEEIRAWYDDSFFAQLKAR